ncbi:Histone transcription regulator 3 [Mortierella sp. GBA30]|nr:Histone transcription regulator 3 [Mortierella sp. GBA30]
MIRFAVLNEEDQSRTKQEEESVEIQAEKCLGIYESAIVLLQKGKLEEARTMLQNLVESDLLQKIDNDSEIAARGTPVRRLQYLVYTNYASILEQSLDGTAESALQFYLKAVAFDDSDNALWVKIGKLAADQKKYRLARYSLECGLQHSSLDAAETSEERHFPGELTDLDLTPSQWSCLETLCEVLYKIGDFAACENYVQKALRISPYFDRGMELLDMMRSRQKNSQDNFDRKPWNKTCHTGNVNEGPKELLLEDVSWRALGEQLLAEYKSLLEASGGNFYNQRLVVRTQKPQDEDTGMSDQASESTIEPTGGETEAAVEAIPATDAKAEISTTNIAEPSSALVASSTSDDTGDHGDKEPTETDQNAALKRKRKEVEERSGLRTSKRVRDKLDQFEVTKKKREEEELETLAKYRLVLSRFGMDLDNGYIASTSSDSLKLDDMFPVGLSGLLQTFNKHLERPNALVQASTMEHIHQQRTNHFAIFTPDKGEHDVSPFFQDSSVLQEFINRTNEHNSGVVEYLCEFIMVVMTSSITTENGSSWQQKWLPGLRTVLNDIVTVIGDQLLEYLNQECRADGFTDVSEPRVKLELQLSISEMYLDEMVRAILQPFTVVYKKGRSAKKIDTDNVARLEKQYLRWLYLAGLGLDPAIGRLLDREDISENSWTQAAILRLNWAQGRHAQCLGNVGEAISRFETCLQIIDSSNALSVMLPNCQYDTRVDAESVQERLVRLKTHQYVLDAERLFEEKDYGAVIARLGPIFLTKDAQVPTTNDDITITPFTHTLGGSLSERLGLMTLLYKSCEALQHRTQQFRCITEMFVQVVETLVNTITDRSEATEIWFLFGQVSQTLYLLRETLQSSSLSELIGSLTSRQLQRLMCCVLAIARLGFVNVLHQDRLVDDDIKTSYSDIVKHRPHLEQFNLVLVRVWLVLLLLIPGWFQEEAAEKGADGTDLMMSGPSLSLCMEPLDTNALCLDPETVQRVLSQPLTTNSSTPIERLSCPSQELYMELIALVHDDLGVRGICGIDNSQLIQLALKVDGQYPIEHSSVHVDFDKKAAIEFFPLLERSLSDKVLRGQVRGDLKDAVERVDEALGSPPYESNSILEMNRQLIDTYLASDINFAEAIQVSATSRLPTMVQPPSSKLPSVYRRIYSMQGKIFLAQFRNKVKNNQFKPLEDLQQAIDQFRTDINVNPNCWDSWYALATCYAFLADENLVFSASDIKNNFSKITDLQKRAFLCFSQAARMAPKRIHHHHDSSLETHHQEPNTKPDDHQKGLSEDFSENSLDNQRSTSEDRESQENGEANGTQDMDMSRECDGREWYQKQAAFWFDFGNLVHGIMSKPMRMEAMRRSAGLETISHTGEPMMISIPEPSEEQVYKFAAFCFKRSLTLNDQNWRTPFMLGKCIEKLNGKPKQTLALYRIAADLVPARSGQPGNEKIFEAAYKIVSTLSKYLFLNKIEPSFVESLISRTLAKSKLSATDGESFIFEPPNEYRQAVEADPPNEEDVQMSGRLRAFRLLCEALARIRHTDKRRWHHRPVYRQAWILYHIYHDVERAKSEMLSLFQIKHNQKTLVGAVWKPEFERSGKHFVYVGEYTKFLIVLAKESKDVETLGILARKIRRAQGLLLELKEIWELLYESYLSVLGDLVGPDPVLAVAEVIPRTEFREKAPIYEAKMFEQEPKGLKVLQRLCELKKLNDKMAPEGQMGHLLAVCYSKLFMEVGGADLYPKELVRQLSSNSELPSTGDDQTVLSNGLDAKVANDTSIEAEDDMAKTAKRVRDADDETVQAGIPLKMAKLTMVGAQVEADAGIVSSDSGAPSLEADLTSTSTAEAKNSETEAQGEEMQDHASSDLTIGSSSTMAPPSLLGTETPSSPAPSAGAKDQDGVSGMEVEPDMEDWKSRKKISAAELASRATNMCKAPPPSLKAPPTLQNKLAGLDNTNAVQEDTATMTAPGEESGDIVMSAASAAEAAESEDAGQNHAVESKMAESTGAEPTEG